MIPKNTTGLYLNASIKLKSRKSFTHLVPPQVAHCNPKRVHVQGLCVESIFKLSHLKRIHAGIVRISQIKTRSLAFLFKNFKITPQACVLLSITYQKLKFNKNMNNKPSVANNNIKNLKGGLKNELL